MGGRLKESSGRGEENGLVGGLVEIAKNGNLKKLLGPALRCCQC